VFVFGEIMYIVCHRGQREGQRKGEGEDEFLGHAQLRRAARETVWTIYVRVRARLWDCGIVGSQLRRGTVPTGAGGGWTERRKMSERGAVLAKQANK
jgi:hypothetical protein